MAEVEDVDVAEGEEGDVASSIIQFVTLTTPLFALSTHAKLFFTESYLYLSCIHTSSFSLLRINNFLTLILSLLLNLCNL